MLCKQLLMRALLQDLSVGQYNDVVRMLDRGKSVGYHSIVPTLRIFSRES